MVKYGGTRAVGVSRDRLRRTADRRNRAETAPKRPQPINEGDIKLYEAAARLRGGPRDSWVYYVADLEAQQRAAERMDTTFPYVRTRAHTTLPWTGGIKGEVWRYDPALDPLGDRS